MNSLPGTRSRRSASPNGAANSQLLVWVILGLVALGGAVWWIGFRGAQGDRAQHIVLIITDTTRWDSFGCYGAEETLTPNMDALAADGVRFDEAIAQSCWTLPTVTSILTSAYPSVHGAVGKGALFHRSREEIPHGQEILGENGFETKAIVNAAFLGPELGTSRGFDDFDYVEGRNWEIRRADASADAAIRFLQENKSRNAFCMLHLFDPHLRYDPPAEFRARFAGDYSGPYQTITNSQLQDLVLGGVVPDEPERAYLRALHNGEIAYMDREIGRLIGALKEMRTYAETTIIVVSDHGEEFWDHRHFEHGHSMYQELIRVPLIVKPPARIVRARDTVATRVRQIDIMPTIFELAGIEPPETFQGESLVPLITGTAKTEHRLAYAEGTLYGSDKLALYRDRYKYIFDVKRGEGELYDVDVDPLESEDLSTRLPGVASELHREMSAMCRDLQSRSAGLSAPEAVDMAENQNRELRERLRSVGYIRDEQETETAKCPPPERPESAG